MADTIRFLVAESETPDARSARRASVGRSSGESYIDTLRSMSPGAVCELVRPAEAGSPPADLGALTGYDAVFLTGSPLHVYDDTPETRRQVGFMRAVFASGTPSFGSCAGLQVATAAAGGTVRANPRGREAGFARHIAPTGSGAVHPLLAGRPAVYDALAIHGDEVAELPPGALLLAGNPVSHVQAAEIRSGNGVFWGVQYHPELPLSEIAAAVRREADTLVGEGLFSGHRAVEAYAAKIEALDHEDERQQAAGELNLGPEVTDAACRRRELRNFIEHLVKPLRSARCRS